MLLFCREAAGLFYHLLLFHSDHKELGTKIQKYKPGMNLIFSFFSAFLQKYLNVYEGLPAKVISSK